MKEEYNDKQKLNTDNRTFVVNKRTCQLLK